MATLRSIALLTVTTLTAHAAPEKIYELLLKDVPGARSGTERILEVAFYRKLPPHKIVDKMLRDSLEQAASVDGTRDILAMAFLGEDALTDIQYSGELVYRAADKRIMTLDESRGLKTTAVDNGTYYVELKEDRTLAGIKPERKWLRLSTVFPHQPSPQQILDAAIAEIQRYAALGVDIDVAPKVGDKNVETSWQQVRDPNGGFYYFRYTASDRTIYNKTAPVKKLEEPQVSASAPGGAAAAFGETITIQQPTTIRVKYGTATLPTDTVLHVVRRDASGIIVNYNGEQVLLPP
jgi:hypothetical protein